MVISRNGQGVRIMASAIVHLCPPDEIWSCPPFGSIRLRMMLDASMEPENLQSAYLASQARFWKGDLLSLC